MHKTIVVEVSTRKTHNVYGKQYTESKRYKVHDPKNTYHVGDVVRFVEIRPISRDKKWMVVGGQQRKTETSAAEDAKAITPENA